MRNRSSPTITERVARLVQPALPEHIPAIAKLVNEHARRGDLLPRTEASIAESLSDWLIGLEDGEVIVCGALYHYNGSLVEVRSLAVADGAKGRGWGSALVTALLALAEERGVPAVFTLTRAVHFFSRLGFEVTDKALYPLKVWKDCQICPLQDHCDETAMALPPSTRHVGKLPAAEALGLAGTNGHGQAGSILPAAGEKKTVRALGQQVDQSIPGGTHDKR